LCAGFKQFFHHIEFPMKVMSGLIRRGRPAAEVMRYMAAEDARLQALFAKTGRNDLCPCGSGRKMKQCHGRSPANRQVSRRPLPKAQQRSTIRLENRSQP
jgi:uncharacterized protein